MAIYVRGGVPSGNRKEESLQVEIRVTTGTSTAIFTSDGGRLSRGGIRLGGVFPIRPEVACSNFARLQNDNIFAQAAQWRFTGDLIRRNDRRRDQPAKIAVAKPKSPPGPTRYTHSLQDQQNHK
jgi:hypothetical protein